MNSPIRKYSSMRSFLTVLSAASVMAACTASQAALVVHSDFDFAGNTIPTQLSTVAYGSGPATGGGVLTFDGTTALRGSTATIYGGSAPANNYGYEVILTPTALNTFDIAAGIVDGGGTNSSNFLFQQSSLYRAIESGEGAFASTTAPVIGTTVALAFVMDNGTGRIYVNGVLQGSRVFSAGGATPIDTASLEAVTLGGNLFDNGANPGGGTAMGAFNGTIDRYRAFTFTAGQFDSTDLLGAADGTIAVLPEPATASLALLGLGGLMLRRRRMA